MERSLCSFLCFKRFSILSVFNIQFLYHGICQSGRLGSYLFFFFFFFPCQNYIISVSVQSERPFSFLFSFLPSPESEEHDLGLDLLLWCALLAVQECHRTPVDRLLRFIFVFLKPMRCTCRGSGIIDIKKSVFTSASETDELRSFRKFIGLGI